VLNFKPDKDSVDPCERAYADLLTKKGEEIAAYILGEPKAVGSWDNMRQKLQAMKESCLQE
jgi:hypothetical protein